MSNCYTTFYFELPLPTAEVVEKVELLLSAADDYQDKSDLEKDKIRETLGDVFEDFTEYEELGFEWDVKSYGIGADQRHTLSVHADEAGNTSHAGNLIDWILPDLDIDSAGFEYAVYGDGQDGGGAQAFIKTDDGVKGEFMNTSSWLTEKMG